MKIYLLLGMLLTQISYANPEWNLKPELEQRLSRALDVSSLFQASQLNKGVTGFVTVGSDSTCDFGVGSSKIQNAINSGAIEIRIASNDTYEEIMTINNPLVNLTIRGGFASCTAAAANIQSDLQQDWTEITRTNGQSGSVFKVTGLPTDNMTVFENIKVVGGDGQGLATGGGLAVVDTESDVVLQNVWLTGGFNIVYGGGLLVQSSNTTVILNNTIINNNQTISSGGGIYCNDFSAMNKFATIVVNSGSSIALNQTQGNGGGAFLFNQCLLASFAGSASPFSFLKNKQQSKESKGIIINAEGISLNEADINGGGVYLNSGAGLLIHGTELCSLAGQCFGDSQNPANMMENTANTNGVVPNAIAGGAIYATGVNTDVTISAAWFNANVANQSSGGAIAIFDKANLTINRNGRDCWDPINCNLFSANRAAFTGGVIYNNDATANISHSVMQGNQANLGVAMYTTNNAQTNVDASIFSDNGGFFGLLSNHLFVANTGADYNIKYATIADNNTEIGIFRIEDDLGTVLLLNSSIIDDVNSGPVLAFGLGGSGFIGAFCVMAHETSSLAGSSNTVDDPEFVDRLNRDYHLSNSSPAIDYCNVLTTPTNKDMDFQSRGWDNPNISNNLGSYDIGADEAFTKSYFTIGTDTTCDFDSTTATIQNVIDTGVGEVRIARNGSYADPIKIDSIGVKLRGGYLDCSAADADNVSLRTQINAPGGVGIPTIEISGANLGNSILIEHISFIGLATNFSAISAFGAVANITLNDVLISGYDIDAFNFGGAINLSSGTIDLTMNDTILINNSAFKGGGIYCDGNSSKITVTGDSGIAHNIAQAEGGGVHVINGCKFTLYSGTKITDATTNIGISDNQAGAEGGGIYADNGAKVTLYGHEKCDNNVCIGNNTDPVNINNNRSDADSTGSERGGGIYATGSGTTVNIYAGLISENLSPNGGGIYINSLASLNVERLSEDCWDINKCNYFFNNRSITTGGAIQSDQGQLNISSTYFEDNKGTSGSALYLFGPSSFARIEGSVFNNNTRSNGNGTFVIRAAAAATVEVVHSTFADNFIQNSATFGVTSNSELKLFSSIISDPEGVVLDTNPGTTIFDCVMAHETSSFTGTNVFLQDPDFIDRDNRDYHLSSNSLAIDVCDSNQSQFKDIDFEQRGWDDPLLPNIVGTFDVGADEAFFELIFSNGFE